MGGLLQILTEKTGDETIARHISPDFFQVIFADWLFFLNSHHFISIASQSHRHCNFSIFTDIFAVSRKFHGINFIRGNKNNAVAKSKASQISIKLFWHDFDPAAVLFALGLPKAGILTSKFQSICFACFFT